MTSTSGNAISIVIPTFNRRARLHNAVESVLRERRVPIVLHVFDNASSDDTEDYVRELMVRDDRVRYSRNAENIGSHANYSAALASVSTRYFVPLADDDWLLPDFLFQAHEILEEHRDAGAAIFVSEVHDAQGATPETYPPELENIRDGLLQPHEHLSDWLRYGHYVWSSILWRDDVLAHIGRPFLHTGLPSDVDFQVQAFCRFPVFLCKRPGAVFSLHAGQAGRSYDASHIRDWALLFGRLDREVAARKIFPPSEYLPLRTLMQQRYQCAWASPSRLDWSPGEATMAAYAAGFRLNDWESAFRLIDGERATIDSECPWTILNLPPLRNASSSSAQIVNRGVGHSATAVLGWMKQASKDLAQLEQASVDLKAEAQRLREANALLEQALQRSDAKCRQAEVSLQSLQRNFLLRVMRKLGVLRTSEPA